MINEVFTAFGEKHVLPFGILPGHFTLVTRGGVWKLGCMTVIGMLTTQMPSLDSAEINKALARAQERLIADGRLCVEIRAPKVGPDGIEGVYKLLRELRDDVLIEVGSSEVYIHKQRVVAVHRTSGK